MHSLSRCSISPSGQFTIGTLNQNTRPSHTPASSQPHEEKPTSPEPLSAPPSKPVADTPAPAPSQPPAQPSEKESSLFSDDPGDMDFDNGNDDAPQAETQMDKEAEESVEDDPWHLEDAYDDKPNHMVPYTRGHVLLDKTKVAKMNEVEKKRKHMHDLTDEEKERELFFRVPAYEFDVFKW